MSGRTGSRIGSRTGGTVSCGRVSCGTVGGGTVSCGTVSGGSPRSLPAGSVVGVVPPSTAPTSPSDGTAGTVVGALPGTVVPAAPGAPTGSPTPAAGVAMVVDVGDDGRSDPFVPEGA